MDKDPLSENELDNRLRKKNPVSRAALDDETVRVALAAVRGTVEQGTYEEGPSRSPRRPVYRRPSVMVGTAAAVVVAASLVGVETLTGGSGGTSWPLAVSPAGAAQLSQVAHAAAQQASGLSAGQWFYTDFTGHTYASYSPPSSTPPQPTGTTTGSQSTATTTGSQSTGTTTGSQPAENATVTWTGTQQDQQWTNSDGEARVRDTNSDFSFATPQDKATYEADKRGFSELDPFMSLGVLTDQVLQVGKQSFQEAPPKDPQALIRNIISTSASLFSHVTAPGGTKTYDLDPLQGDRPELYASSLWGDLVSYVRSSPNAETRSIAYSALEYVPDTTVLGGQTDSLGRPGIAIRFDDPNHNNAISTLIVDPKTGDPLEEDEAIQKPEGALPAGTVVNRVTYQPPVIVDSDTSLPDGSTLPIDPNAPVK